MLPCSSFLFIIFSCGEGAQAPSGWGHKGPGREWAPGGFLYVRGTGVSVLEVRSHAFFLLHTDQ